MHSAQGGGTTAGCWFFRRPAVNAGQEPLLCDGEGAGIPGPPRVVVAVDDNARVLGGTVSMLEDLGDTVGPATLGQQALDVVRGESDAALVIANQGMLGMSGVELVRMLSDTRPRVPAILRCRPCQGTCGSAWRASARPARPTSVCRHTSYAAADG